MNKGHWLGVVLFSMMAGLYLITSLASVEIYNGELTVNPTEHALPFLNGFAFGIFLSVVPLSLLLLSCRKG